MMTARLKLYDERCPGAVCGPGVHLTGYLCDGCAEEQAAKEAIGAAISVLSAQDARGFFEHCGYRAMVQPF
jgi:hypothetical protein